MRRLCHKNVFGMCKLRTYSIDPKMTLFALFCILFYFSFGRVILEKESKIPSDWTKLKRISPTANLQLIFALKQNNLKKLDDLFWAVSSIISAKMNWNCNNSQFLDPESPEYGNHLTMAEVNALVAPSQTAVHTVLHWIRYARVSCSSFLISTILFPRTPSFTSVFAS